MISLQDLELASHHLSSLLHFIPSWQRAAMPGPETPPRYRYTKSGDSDDEAKESDAKDKVGTVDRFDKAQAAVLTSRKRSGSLGRPLCMSRVLDRQRHGGEVQNVQNCEPQSQAEPRRIRGWSEAPRRFVLQAPPLLKLGHLQTPVLPDPLNSFGMPGKVQSAYPGSEGIGACQTAFVPPAPPAPPAPALGNPFGGPCGPCGPCGPFPFQPTPSFDLRAAAAASRRSLSTGRSFPSAPAPAAPMPLGAAIPPVGITPRPGGFPYHSGLQQPQGLNLFGAMSVPTPTRARRDSEEHCRKDRRGMEELGERQMFPTGSFSCEGAKMQIRPPEKPQDSVSHGRFDGFQGVQGGFQGPGSMASMASMGFQGFQGFQTKDWPAGSFTERSSKPKDERPKDQASHATPLWREQLLEIEVATAMEAAHPLRKASSNGRPAGEKTLHGHKDAAETAGTSASGGSLWSSAASFAAPEQASRPAPRVLVTGATGLLGRQMMQTLSSTSWEVRGLCKSRAQPPTIVTCDLTQEEAFWQLMQQFRPQVVLHLAAEWRPEALRQSPEQARQLNVDAAGTVAAACEKFKAWLVHLSADCVFDGTKPPYSVESRPNPLSEYGWQKLHSEQLVRAACPTAAVLRVPLLYGPVESPLDSAITSLYTDLRNGIREVDAWQCCYPTWAGDVANVLKGMVELHLSGERLQGIYHWQGNEQFTWHEMMLLVAETTGLDASGISAVTSPPATSLPRDARLECSRLNGLLGDVQHTSLREGLTQCLAPFRQAPAMAGQIAVKPKPKTQKVEWKALPRGAPCRPKGLLSDLKGQNAALQEIFWEELERTRARLQQAAISEAILALRATADSLERALQASQHGAVTRTPGSASSGHWDLISDLPSPPAAHTPVLPVHGYSSSYDQVADLITTVPKSQVELCARLGSTAEESRQRAQRAWEAGLWAKATLEGRIPKPRPTPKLAQRPTVYLVIRGPGIVQPVRVGTATEYFRLVPRFTEDSVSHSFPSIAEAKVSVLEQGNEILVAPVLIRKNGVLLAVASGVLPVEVLAAGESANPTDLIGPHRTIHAEAVTEEEDGTETDYIEGLILDLVDFHASVLPLLREFDPVTDSGAQPFLAESPEAVPKPASLLTQAYDWLQMSEEDRIGFYTAAEETTAAPRPKQAAPVTSGPPVPKKQTKRVTAAALSEQVSGLAQTLPALTQQLEALQAQQKRLEEAVSTGTAQQRTPAYRQPFQTPPALPSRANVRSYLTGIGPPPRTRPVAPEPSPGQQTGGENEVLFGEEPAILPSEEGYAHQIQAAQQQPQEMSLSQLLFQQSQALTTLVGHIANQDGLDFGGGSSSGSAISLRGSSKREKLLSDLAQRKGQFMLKIAQNAHRRLKPAEPVPQSLDGFGARSLFTKYLEKHGGYAGSKDLGLAMWLLAQVADQMLQKDWIGAQEMLALAMVSIEQAAHDGNKWEVAWLLALQEEPPTTMFASRPVATNPRLRAFSPLCPPEWATTTLSYVKELDIINSRRTEVLPGKKPPASQTDEQEGPGRCYSSDLQIHPHEALADGLLHSSCPDSLKHSGQAEDSYVPGPVPARSKCAKTPPESPWERMQQFSFEKWCSQLCTKVLRSRTSFAEFLKTTFHAERLSTEASSKALFPLPIPKFGIFSTKRGGSKERRRAAFDQAFHIMVMAVNYWHADFRFVPPHAMAVQPSAAQRECLATLRNFLKAFGSCGGEFHVPSSGRRTPTLLSQLSDLSTFMTAQGLSSEGYHYGFQGYASGEATGMVVPFDDSRADELRPYRPLDAERLKISGGAAWDPQPYLSDDLHLAYVEPNSLIWTNQPPDSDFPDLTKEKYSAVVGLVKLWDARGLLTLREVAPSYSWKSGAMRFFNNFKNQSCDRMIGDRRLRNWREARLPGVSRALPTAAQLAVIEICPQVERLSICISDRRDFYHQFKVSSSRASSNGLWPLITPEEDLASTTAYAEFLQRRSQKESYVRERHGDGFAEEPRNHHRHSEENPGGCLQACFASLPQGDHLGVEFATDSHRNLLKQYGLLTETEELRSDRVFRGFKRLQGLVIDDFYAVSVTTDPLQFSQHQSEDLKKTGATASVRCFEQAQVAYEQQGLLGSSDKDVVDSCFAKVTGGELDSRQSTRKLGLTLLSSPATKRLALAFISLELSSLTCSTDALHSCLLGGWTHALLYRRPFMSLLNKAYKLVTTSELTQGEANLIPLPRDVAEEFVMLSVLCPLMSTNLAAIIDDQIYATDSSDKIGAYCNRPAPQQLVRALWRTGRKRGGYARMLTREEALIRKLDSQKQEHEFILSQELPQEWVDPPDRPIAFRYHFVEVCGGAGKISKFIAESGWTVGPVLDLDTSPHYDLAGLELLRWIYFMLEKGRLDSLMLEPPCTTFSPAQHPASRSYSQPRGFDPTNPKTLLGTTLALRSLACLKLAADISVPGLLETPRRSKMRKLQEWLWLLSSGAASEVFSDSCMFGSQHQKGFTFLVTNLDTEGLSRRCDWSHQHIPIQGQYTKASAVYVDGLARQIATCFDRSLRRQKNQAQLHNPRVHGLESPLINDVLLSGSWQTISSWIWRKPAHINVFETNVVCRLLKHLAICKPHCRSAIVMDSNVGLSALVKGRSPSQGLRSCTRRAGATCIAGDLYPSYHFGPTRRAESRGDGILPVGRPVLGTTQQQRDKLLKDFSVWLSGEGVDIDLIIGSGEPDTEAANLLLERYGRELYKAGRPYGHYAETVNAISAAKPRLRRLLQPAWDLAYSWLRQEPPIHHVALPWQLLLSLLTTALTWGWTRVAGVIALSWGAIARIGEVLAAQRQNLVLPADIGGSIYFALLEIQEPKTRFRTARHQAARIDQPQLLKVVEIAFQALLPHQRLWPQSAQTMRARFQSLLDANGVGSMPQDIKRGLDLGSLRAGGASWLLLTSEDSELTRRRGRWINTKIMEIYVQEVGALQFLPRLKDDVKSLVLHGMALFPWSLATASRLKAAQAGINRKRGASEKLMQDQAAPNGQRSGRLDEQRV
eukprot:s1074_g16.t1